MYRWLGGMVRVWFVTLLQDLKLEILDIRRP